MVPPADLRGKPALTPEVGPGCWDGILCDDLGHREDVGSGWACPLGLHRILTQGRRRLEGDSDYGDGRRKVQRGAGGTWG